MERLNAVVFPFPDESPTSVLNRTAYANGFKNLNALRRYLKCSRFSIRECIFADSRLNDKIYKDIGTIPTFELMGFYQRAYRISKYSPPIINGIKVSHKLLRGVDAARCPICTQIGWDHYIKDIKIALRCPFHNIPYIIKCPNCGKKTRWDMQLLDTCHCGHHITDNKNIEIVDATAERELLQIFEEHSQDKFNLLSSTLYYLDYDFSGNPTESNRKILNAALAVAHNNTENLVEYLTHLSCQFPLIDPRLLVEKLPPIGNKAIKQARSTFLKEPSTQASEPLPDCELTFRHSQISRYLNLSKKEWLTFARDLYPAGLVARGKRCNVETILSIQETLKKASPRPFPTPDSTVISLRDTAKLLEVDYESIRQSTKFGFFERSATSAKGYLTKASIQKFNENYIFSTALSKILNTSSHSIVKQLDLIGIRPISSLALDGNRTPIFLKQDVCTLTTGEVPFRTSPSPTKSHGAVYVRSLPTIPADLESLYCDTTEAASRLHLDTSVVLQLCKTSLLGKVYKSPPRSRILLSRSEIKKFHENYVGITELSKTLEFSRNSLSWALHDLGIYQATGPLVDGGHAPFFKRSDIKSDTASRLRSQAYTYIRFANSSTPTYLSLKQTSLRLGVSRRQLNELIEQKKIHTRTPTPGLSIPQTGALLESISEYELWASSLVPIATALEKLGLNRRRFNLRFIKSGFLKFYYFHKGTYISHEDFLRASINVEKFCDCTEANRLLGTPFPFSRNHLKLQNFVALSPEDADGINSVILLDKNTILDRLKIIK
ncbi:hypothetical protein [Pseudomonas sp. TCU-HL1]|uniref:hypothetical protein n=1 Tax=Pseudomonas sp. TCU-HL1 TaxID=1856685 RepID=UPI000855B323|nr:hypothetical protein [Pseudomonas sp. TCU-HL1]AOE85940.1 hypothetical protein THL1_3392 [Pseudomonas sp. TCU-HL1]